MKLKIAIVLALMLVAVSAMAGGGKVRGDKGAGGVYQIVGP